MDTPTDSIGAVLVDYDNIKPNRKETVSIDVASNLVLICDRIADSLKKGGLNATEVHCYFYGGWNDERGAMTTRGNWILASLSKARGLRGGVRIYPHMAVTVAASKVRLKGLSRRVNGQLEQKMVDTLMAVDTLYFESQEFDFVGIATDDDDLVPPLLASVNDARPKILLRTAAKISGINDGALADHGVRLLTLGA